MIKAATPASSRGDRRPNAKPAALRGVVRRELGIIAIDLASGKEAVAVMDPDSARSQTFGTAQGSVDIQRGPRVHGRDVTMPKRYPRAFKRDVVHVALTSGLPHGQIAADVRISGHSVQRWLGQAKVWRRARRGHDHH